MRFGVARDDKGQIIKNAFVDSEYPSIVMRGDEAHSPDEIALILQSHDGKAFAEPPEFQGVRSPLGFEVRNNAPCYDGLEEMGDCLDAVFVG